MPAQIENVTFYNVDEAGAVLDHHRNTILSYLNNGLLTGAKTKGGEWIVSHQELTRYLLTQDLRDDAIEERFRRAANLTAKES